MTESEYKQLMRLKEKLMRAEETDEKQRELATLRTKLLTQKVRIEDEIQNLTELDQVYEELLADL